jgi:hypothetical protein
MAIFSAKTRDVSGMRAGHTVMWHMLSFCCVSTTAAFKLSHAPCQTQSERVEKPLLEGVCAVGQLFCVLSTCLSVRSSKNRCETIAICELQQSLTICYNFAVQAAHNHDCKFHGKFCPTLCVAALNIAIGTVLGSTLIGPESKEGRDARNHV